MGRQSEIEDVLGPELARRLRRAPDSPIRLIVGVAGDLGVRADEASRHGLTVYRRLSLIAALAVEGTGKQALQLIREPWVRWAEEDREVRALAPGAGGGR